jgi:hypothetical protein
MGFERFLSGALHAVSLHQYQQYHTILLNYPFSEAVHAVAAIPAPSLSVFYFLLVHRRPTSRRSFIVSMHSLIVA